MLLDTGPPKPSKVTKAIADIVWTIILFFVAFAFFIIIAPSVLSHI